MCGPQVLVGKTLEQALMEVHEDIELENIRARQVCGVLVWVGVGVLVWVGVWLGRVVVVWVVVCCGCMGSCMLWWCGVVLCGVVVCCGGGVGCVC